MLVGAALGAALAVLPLLASAQQKQIDVGKREYDANCAVCHGPAGRGDGPYAGLPFGVPDITQLARRNGGVFPFQRVYETIDGTLLVKAHGTRDMPIWGRDYQARADEYYVDVPYSPEFYVRTRILALAEYVYRLQAK
jgi:mono/diheme cytochrome c family protein